MLVFFPSINRERLFLHYIKKILSLFRKRKGNGDKSTSRTIAKTSPDQIPSCRNYVFFYLFQCEIKVLKDLWSMFKPQNNPDIKRLFVIIFPRKLESFDIGRLDYIFQINMWYQTKVVNTLIFIKNDDLANWDQFLIKSHKKFL